MECPRFDGHRGSGPAFSESAVWSQAAICCWWLFSYSVGVSMPRAEWRRAGVVEDLDVVVDRGGELDAGLPASAVEQLDLHPGPERFDHRRCRRGADRSHRGQRGRRRGPSG